MKFTIPALVFALYLAGSSALPAPSSRVFEKLSNIPTGWTQDTTMRVTPESNFRLKIHLKQTNVEAFEQKLVDMSTPNHPDYGKHMSNREIKDMMMPTDVSVLEVTSWLQTAGFASRMTRNEDWIFVDATVAEAESLLSTKYQVYQHEGSQSTTVRTTEYSLPAHLHDHVQMIQPTTLFTHGARGDAMHTQVERVSYNGTSPSCATSITPSCLADLYGFADFNYPTNAADNKLGVCGYLSQFAQNADLTTFLHKYVPNAKQGTSFTCTPVDGGLCSQGSPRDNIREANLDIQYTVGISNPTPNTYWSTVDDQSAGATDPFIDWLTYILKQDNLPQVITTSYGLTESQAPSSYLTSVCNMYAQLGARGVSVLYSSGDSGPGDQCQTADGTLAFAPVFPASCPWLTSVGSTGGIAPERSAVFSSGGFSNQFGRPAYQDDAISQYLTSSSLTQFSQYFNASGRGMPDVSTQGVKFHVIEGGIDYTESGTSASSPTFAGIISLLNADRLSNGQKALGFLNPWIYGKAKGAFTDIVDGTSLGCNGTIDGAGFAAVPGWDASTGVGTPLFKQLLALSRST